jgi:hypothetical protein
MNSKKWDGKAVLVQSGLGEMLDRRPVRFNLTEKAARDLALALKRLQQTSLMNPESVTELVDALDFVLVGDPASRAAHARMEAGKGMAPSDEHLKADHDFLPHEHPNQPGVFRCGYARSKHDASGFCWRTEAEHG